eukprot:26083-Pelagococcus_subviridis.AAC.1
MELYTRVLLASSLYPSLVWNATVDALGGLCLRSSTHSSYECDVMKPLCESVGKHSKSFNSSLISYSRKKNRNDPAVTTKITVVRTLAVWSPVTNVRSYRSLYSSGGNGNRFTQLFVSPRSVRFPIRILMSAIARKVYSNALILFASAMIVSQWCLSVFVHRYGLFSYV